MNKNDCRLKQNERKLKIMQIAQADVYTLFIVFMKTFILSYKYSPFTSPLYHKY